MSVCRRVFKAHLHVHLALGAADFLDGFLLGVGYFQFHPTLWATDYFLYFHGGRLGRERAAADWSDGSDWSDWSDWSDFSDWSDDGYQAAVLVFDVTIIRFFDAAAGRHLLSDFTAASENRFIGESKTTKHLRHPTGRTFLTCQLRRLLQSPL